MSFQFTQVAHILICIIFIVLIYVVKNTKVKIVLLIIGALIIFFNPVRFKQEGISKIERREFNTVTELPERVIVKRESFNESQINEMNKLKKQSKEIIENENN